MLFRKIDLAAKYGIPLSRLDRYEAAGILKPIRAGDYVTYSGELMVSVIAKAEKLGFTSAEIVALIRQGLSTARTKLD